MANDVVHLFMELAIPLPSFVKCCVLGTVSLLNTFIADGFLSIGSSRFHFLSGVHKDRSFKFNEIFIRLFYNFPLIIRKVRLAPGCKNFQLCVLLEVLFCSFHAGFFFLLMC